MKCLIVIPARWGSTRLPGKPLIPIAGRPLLGRVIDLARTVMRASVEVDLVVATDDQRVAEFAWANDCRIAMTARELSSGSSRVLAAAREEATPPRFVVNLQGDAPFVPPAALVAIIAMLRAGARVATPVRRLSWDELDALRQHKERAPFSGTTCTVSPSKTALWFSKRILPAIRDEKKWRASLPLSPVLQHLGLYGYTIEALAAFETAAPGIYEKLEGLEQLRFFDLNIPIHVAEVQQSSISMGGIDTLKDVELAERLISTHGEPLTP